MRPEERPRLLARRRLGTDGHVRLERNDARQAHPDQIVIVDEHDLQLVRHDSSRPVRPRPMVVRAARHDHRQPGAAARPAVDMQHAAELVDPLANALQAEMRAGLSCGPCPMPHPSSCDDELGRVRGKRSMMSMRRAPGVLDGVGQRFEADAQQVMLVRRVEPVRRPFDAHFGDARRADASSAAPCPSARRRGRGFRAPASADP